MILHWRPEARFVATDWPIRHEFTAIVERDNTWHIAYCAEAPGAKRGRDAHGRNVSCRRAEDALFRVFVPIGRLGAAGQRKRIVGRCESLPNCGVQ